MKQEPKDNCKGCVCASCSKSSKNGNIYGCPRCVYMDCNGMRRLSYCFDWNALKQEEGGDVTIWDL